MWNNGYAIFFFFGGGGGKRGALWSMWKYWIERFHSHGQQLCKLVATKESVYIIKGINPHRNGLLLICDFTTGKKKTLCRSICRNFENQQQQTPEFLPFFQTLTLFSRLSPGLENCFANQFYFFQNSSRLCRNPVSYYQAYLLVPHHRVWGKLDVQ